MGQCRVGLLCLGLLVLVLGQDFANSKHLVNRRRGSWQRRSVEIGWSSGSRGAHVQYNQWPGRGLVGRSIGGLGPRQPQPPHSSPISVQCREDRMLVTVQTDLYGTGRLMKASDLTLGPQSCNAGPLSTDTAVVFEVGLQECGSSLQVTPDWIIYGTNLTFNPPTGPQNIPVTHKVLSVIPIKCYYPRYGNVSSRPLQPTWFPFITTVSSDERLVFSLRLMTEDWTTPRSSLVFNLGDVFYVEASLESKNHLPFLLFIDFCVATTSADITSTPRYEVIAHNGCLMDGTQDDSSSAFKASRPQAHKLQFMVDTFWFLDSQASTIYITCSLRAAPDTQTPDPMNKACSYNKTSSSWTAVEGPSAICNCCNTQDCAPPAGQSRGWNPTYGRPRGPGKRDAAEGARMEDQRALASVGPLLVLGDHHTPAVTGKRSPALELGIRAVVGGLGFVIVLVCFSMFGRCLKKSVHPP